MVSKVLRRSAAAALAVFAAFGFYVQSFAATGDAISVTSSDSPVYCFQQYSSGAWKDYSQPLHYVERADGSSVLVYCMEGGKAGPSGSMTVYEGEEDILAALSGSYVMGNLKSGVTPAKLLLGLKTILSLGYPNAEGSGLSEDQQRYATSAAMHCWVAMNTAKRGSYSDGLFGYYKAAEAKPLTLLRPSRTYSASGSGSADAKAAENQPVYDFFLALLDAAENGALPEHSAALSPLTQTLKEDAASSGSTSGNFSGKVNVTLLNMNQGYKADFSEVTDLGGKVSGYTGKSGDVLTVTIPKKGNTKKTVNIKITACDSRGGGNLSLFMPPASKLKTIQVTMGFAGLGGNLSLDAFAAVTTPNYGLSVKLSKASSDASVNGHPLYSLEGAKYSLSGKDASGKAISETVTLDASGSGSSSLLYAVGSKVTIKETAAPKGFVLDTASHSITVSEDVSKNVLKLSDAPIFASAEAVLLKKADATGVGRTLTWAPAVFKVELFGNYTATGTALKTYYCKTGSDGVLRLSDKTLLESGSEKPFTDASGNVVLPLGSLKISEYKAPEGYEKSTVSATGTIKAGSDGTAVFQWDSGSLEALAKTIYGTVSDGVPVLGNKAKYSSISVNKNANKPQGNASFEGIKITVTNASGHVIYVKDSTQSSGAKAVKNGAAAAVITLDASGSGSTGDILPFGTYTLKETSVPAASGYVLNSAWSRTVTIDSKYDKAQSIEFSNDIKLFGVAGTKFDSGKKKGEASGDGTLAGTVITVYNRSENPVTVGGVSYAPGDAVATMSTLADGTFRLGAVLPYGSYELKETKAPSGYARSLSWSYAFTASPEDPDRKVFEIQPSETIVDSILPQYLRIRKWDKSKGIGQSGAADPLEALENVRFEVVNASVNSVRYGGTEYAPGAVITVVSTIFDEASGEYAAEIKLPYGTYKVMELPSESDPDMANDYYLWDDREVKTAVMHGKKDTVTTLDFADSRACSLTVKKTVEGNMGSKDKDFGFSVSFSEEIKNELIWEKTFADGGVTSGKAALKNGAWDFTLKHGETMRISRLPFGTHYEIKETDAQKDAYTATFTGSPKGEMTGNISVLVTNSRWSVVNTGIASGSGGFALAGSAGLAACGLLIKGKKGKNNALKRGASDLGDEPK